MSEERAYRLAVVVLLAAMFTVLVVISWRLDAANEQLCDLANDQRGQFAQVDCEERY